MSKFRTVLRRVSIGNVILSVMLSMFLGGGVAYALNVTGVDIQDGTIQGADLATTQKEVYSSVAPKQLGQTKVQCPPGSKAIAGGSHVNMRIQLTVSRQDKTNPAAWEVVVYNPTAYSELYGAYAVCVGIA